MNPDGSPEFAKAANQHIIVDALQNSTTEMCSHRSLYVDRASAEDVCDDACDTAAGHVRARRPSSMTAVIISPPNSEQRRDPCISSRRIGRRGLLTINLKLPCDRAGLHLVERVRRIEKDPAVTSRGERSIQIAKPGPRRSTCVSSPVDVQGACHEATMC